MSISEYHFDNCVCFVDGMYCRHNWHNFCLAPHHLAIMSLDMVEKYYDTYTHHTTIWCKT
jgi:hypothetical protein